MEIRFNLGRYPEAVTIEGRRPVEECAEAMNRLARRFFTLDRARPFVGEVSGTKGRLWYARKLFMTPSARSLRFQLVATEEGCRLEGELAIAAPIRWFTGAYLLFCVIASFFLVFWSLRSAREVSWLYELRLLIQGPLFGIVFLYGYHGFCMVVSRAAERQGLKILRAVMQGPAEESVVLDLFDIPR